MIDSNRTGVAERKVACVPDLLYLKVTSLAVETLRRILIRPRRKTKSLSVQLLEKADERSRADSRMTPD